MNYPDFVTSRCKFGGAIVKEMTPLGAHLIHMSLGVAGEVGELIDSITDENDKEEIGDILFYLQGIENATDIHVDIPELYCIEDWRVEIVVGMGALVDIIKKHVIYQRELDKETLREVILKIKYSLAEACVDIDYSIEQAQIENMDKLNKRYHQGAYSDQQASERADK